jgi:hypothetical protein
VRNGAVWTTETVKAMHPASGGTTTFRIRSVENPKFGYELKVANRLETTSLTFTFGTHAALTRFDVNPKPLKPKPETRNPKPETRNPKPKS